MERDPYAADPYAPGSSGLHAATPPMGALAAHRGGATERGLWADAAQLQKWSFLGGIVGGVLILVGAFALALFVTVLQLVGPAESDVWFLDGDNFPGAAIAVALWGLLTAGLVLAGAVRSRDTGEDGSALPGALMIGGGLLSFFALGGFLVGGLVAILAGAASIAAARSVFPERRAERPLRARPLG